MRYLASKSGVTLKTGLGFVQGHWKWLAPFDRWHTSSYSSSMVTIALPYIICKILLVIGQKSRNFYTPPVFSGVTLRLLAVNISSSGPASNKLRRLLATSVINLPLSVAAECIALGCRTVHSTRWSQILADNRDFCLAHLHSMPPLGGSRRNIAITFGTEKLEWCGYLTVKTLEDMAYSFRQSPRT